MKDEDTQHKDKDNTKTGAALALEKAPPASLETQSAPLSPRNKQKAAREDKAKKGRETSARAYATPKPCTPPTSHEKTKRLNAIPALNTALYAPPDADHAISTPLPPV